MIVISISSYNIKNVQRTCYVHKKSLQAIACILFDNFTLLLNVNQH